MKCYLCGGNNIMMQYDLDEFKVMMCKACGLAFLSDFATENETANMYDSDYYRERKEYYFENVIATPQKGRWNDNLDDFVAGLEVLTHFVHTPGRLLDIGCGIGIFLNLAKKHEWQVTGLDISEFAVEYAKERFGLDVHQGELRKKDFPSHTFDVVTLWDTFEHMTDPMGELREIRRILKPGGILLLDTPNADGLLRRVADVAFRMTAGRFRYPLKKLYHKYHLYYFNSANLTRALQQAGFSVLRLQRKPIPTVKARGSKVEKALVRSLSVAEKVLGKEYELFVIAGKDNA